MQRTADETADRRLWVKPYYNSFNGLRGLAVGMVFLCHYGHFLNLSRVENVTWTGVDLFFVLSGFLITGILYDSLSSPHYFRDFYIRRALRIFPIFYGFFLVLFLLAPIVPIYFHWNILTFVFYVGNLTVPFTNLNVHNPTMLWIVHGGQRIYAGNIGALWSLCVEEQFYLIWPAVVFGVRDRRRLMRLCAVCIVLTLLGRIYLYKHATVQEIQQYLLDWSTYTRCDTLLMGAWLSLYLRGSKLTRSQLYVRASGLVALAMTALFLGVHHWRTHHLFFNPFILTMGFTLIGLGAAGVLLFAIDEENLLSRLLQSRPLSGLGTISYGFYFYHMLPIGLWELLSALHPRWTWPVGVLAFLSTLTVSILSYHYLETPFLRLKKVWAPRRLKIRETSEEAL